MGVLRRMFRVSEWFGSKLPLQIAVFLAFAYAASLDAFAALLPFLLFLAYAVTYFCLGYLANDLSDVEVDRKAGKRNAFLNVALKEGIVVFVVTTLLHFGVACLISFSWEFLTLVAAGYFFGVFYSFRPFRFKERGVVGLVVASVCQRNLQLLVLPFLFAVDWTTFILVNVACFVYGLRYILIHQYMDYDNDKVSGTKTFVGSAKRMTKGLILACVGVELCGSFAAFFLLLSGQAPVFIVLLIAGYGVELATWLSMRLLREQNIFTSYHYVPMNFLYLFLLPALSVLVITLASGVRWYWGGIYLCSVALAFYKTLKFHVEHIRFVVEKICLKRSCKRLLKFTRYAGGVRYINVQPTDGEGGKATGDYVVISPMPIRLSVETLAPYFTENTCVEVRYPLPQEIELRIASERALFQTQNGALRGYFSVYIFHRKDLGRFFQSTPSKTIVNAVANCEKVQVVKGELSPEFVNPEGISRGYAVFSGLACGELYERRRDCFMRLFPTNLLLFSLALALSVVGWFLKRGVALFGVVFAVGCLFSWSTLKIVYYKKRGVSLVNAWAYRRNLHRKVPFYKAYGIYTDKIVEAANLQRQGTTCTLLSLAIACLCATLAVLGGIV